MDSPMSSATRLMTEADLLATPNDGWKRELVDGEIRAVCPAGIRHDNVIMELAGVLVPFVKAHGLGSLTASSAGYRMPGGNVRVPDAAFVATGRFGQDRPDGFSDVVPDLAVEVLSPSDREREVLDKVGEYLMAGVRLVWVIDPRARRAVAYRSLTDVREIREDDALDGGDVVPGFRCRLADLLD